MNVFELFATLGLDSSQYEEGLAKGQEDAQAFSSTVGTVLSAGVKVGTAAIAGLTAATVAGSVAFVNGVASTAEYADSIDKLSQKMGFGVESFQEWQYVAQISGTSMESLKSGMKTLATAVETGSEAFDKLGLSQEELASMSQEEVFEATITALQGVEDQSERTYLASQLLGKGATELGPMLNLTAEEVEALKQEAHDLGGVLSEDQVKAGADFQDSLLGMQTALTGLKNNLLSEFLPSFSTVMDGLALIFAGDDGGLALIDEGVDTFIQNLNEVAPKALEVGATILSNLITAISTNLPGLLSQGSSVLQTLIQGIIQALPSLLQSAIMIIGMIGSALLDNASLLFSTALQLILMLATSLTENAPALIPAIVSVVHEIASTLTEPSMLQLLIECALQLILALAEGILLATPDLISIIPEVYGNVIMTLVDEFPSILSAVVELLGILGAEVFAIIGGLLGMNYDQIASALVNAGNLIQISFDAIKNWFSNLSSDLISKVTSMWTSITGWFTSGLNDASNTVSSVLGSISDTFSSIFDNVVSVVTTAIDTIKGLFDFEWSLPELKLPHFSVTGSLDLLADPPKYPSVSVDWYAKGYSDAYILNGATIFGSQGGSLLGGGEGSGGEVVVGTSKLMEMMTQVVKNAIDNRPIVVQAYFGNEKFDEYVVKSNQRNDFISGGRG